MYLLGKYKSGLTTSQELIDFLTIPRISLLTKTKVLFFHKIDWRDFMHLRLLDKPDAKTYQVIRLQALKNDPESFGSTYEQEVNKPLEKFAERIKLTNNQFTLGCFDSSHTLIGIIHFAREDRLKTEHKGLIYGMYVKREFRRRGIGKTILLALIERAMRTFDEELEQIHLTVVSTNKSAKRLYTSLGFEVYGVEPNALKIEGCYFDEDLMILHLNKFNDRL